ncbi:MAG: VOC family protein [Gemmatimonadota bacterium]|nr:VOC family protein [Gemmatimonadota bacterium]
MPDRSNASDTELSLGRIGQIAITVRDLDRAVAFYRDVLGMKFLFKAPPKMAFFDCGDVRLLLGEPESAGGELHSSVIYYLVDDIRSASETLKARGATIKAEPAMIAKMPDHELWLCELRDSEDNALALMSEVR